MARAGVLQEVRRMRFEGLLDRHERGELGQAEAAEMLGVSERTFRRWRDRLRDEGPAGLLDRRIGKPSSRRAAADEILRMLGLYREVYSDFTVKHFHEQLVKRHGYKLGYTVTRLSLQSAGLVRRAPKRSAHRKKRPRRPLPGMMLHQDASRFAWLPGDARQYDLVVTLDDATSAIYSAFLVEEEGTCSSFRGLREVIERQGLFCELYTDRGSHYFETPAAGGPVSRVVLTQVGRALNQLGINHIAAYSPQARGRSERAFGTLQDRLPKELRLAGIATMEAANRWIAQSYIEEHNAAFAVAPEQEGSAFVPDPAGLAADILCIQEERQVGNDNTVKWYGRRLQIPPSPQRAHFVRAKVRVHQYPDGGLAVFYGPRCLARYSSEGAAVEIAAAA
ncbi:MAG: ISNCY family transposase [Acetobacteraceae bacterium]|nr:ISNCY family transposase [Acetobacteraceae bacterium]MBV8576518.1 ISNCY family transposase [Acetobacteraceae bacterium]